ncbi:ABC transporter family substrate-binding protein [Ornithinimicrobium ciconiae]|uniref:ABC transporter family substrate-binding protein n=1 Tax=Ornithinimicrobium ciconiae TaxID=2594265 RepID=A0A516GBL4_9MICO|nr:ABC transporter substrate-binding protein [Ornithinimicrobium ciconiae]QDO88888.1 ABC transporter family substrate-binding protein [Ornithinimicrobium ciconiae]
MAIVAAGALVLSACTSGTEDPDDTTTDDTQSSEDDSADGDDASAAPGDDGSETSGPDGGEDAAPADTAKPDLGDITTKEDNIYFSVGADEWAGLNANTAETNSVYNAVVSSRLGSSFWYYGTDGTIYPDEDFGTYEVTSEDPLTVEYTISDQAVWEDGTPITYNDFLLEWVAQNPPSVFGEAPEGDEDYVPTFNNVGTDWGLYVPDGPEGELDGKTFTLTYPDPYPDYQLMVGGPTGPAHVAAAESGMTPEELVTAIKDGDAEALAPVGEFWNTGWLSPDKTLPDPAIAQSSGPYTIDGSKGAEWSVGEYVTLGPNDVYWGPPPATSNLTFRFAAPETHVQALSNGDLNIIEPQATVDTVQQLEALGDTITIDTGDTMTFEHLDYNFAEGSPFAEDAGGLAAREAFAYCVPRQQIVDNLLKPITDEAVVMNSREVFPFQEGYEEHVGKIYDGRYDQIDLETAKTKFEESGLEEGTQIRIGYGAGNQRRVDQVALIKASCDQVGFEIVDASAPGLGDVLASGDWEIALFAWAGSGTVTGSAFWYQIGNEGGNFGQWVNEPADTAWSVISTTLDETVREEQLVIIESEAWNDLHSIPVFAHPGVVAYDSTLQNVILNASQTGVPWNAEQWVRSE